MEWCLNLRLSEATSEKWSIIGWEGHGVVCWYSMLQDGSPCLCRLMTVYSGPFNEHWLCTDSMPDLWGPVNRRSSMIVVVGRYPTIPLEMNIGIVYGSPTDSPVCDIMWKTCTRERWDPDRPNGIVAKGCHKWSVHESAYVMLVKFITLPDWLLIRISATLSDMSDSLFTAPTRRNACLLLYWWIKMVN
jgi:hypothetical protein